MRKLIITAVNERSQGRQQSSDANYAIMAMPTMVGNTNRLDMSHECLEITSNRDDVRLYLSLDDYEALAKAVMAVLPKWREQEALREATPTEDSTAMDTEAIMSF
jgi:hypothetical protein